MCTLDESVKQGKKDNGVVKGAIRLIGNMATLPLRTASSVVKNVTGFDASEAAYNAIKNSVVKEEQSAQQINLQQPQILSGGQPLTINHKPQQPQIQTGINHTRMQGGNQNSYTASPANQLSKLTDIQSKLSRGGSLTQDEIQYIGNL